MATNGNSAAPTEQQQLKAVAETVGQTTAVEDFLSRAESALQLLEVIARELGSVGGADEREIAAFAEGQRSDLQAFVRKIVTRYRRRVSDLERILGKIDG